MLKNYLATALGPVVTRGVDKEEEEGSDVKNLECAAVGESKQESGEEINNEGINEGAPQSEAAGLANGGGSLSEGSDRVSVRVSVLTQQPANVPSKSSNLAATSTGSSDDGSCLEVSAVASTGTEVVRSTGEEAATGSDCVVGLAKSSEPEFISEFGVQELSVLTVGKGEKKRSPSVESKPPSTDPPTTPRQTPPAPLIPSVPQKKPLPLLQSGGGSAFKPVLLGGTKQSDLVSPTSLSGAAASSYGPDTPPTCTSSQLTSLLTSPISRHPKPLLGTNPVQVPLITVPPPPPSSHNPSSFPGTVLASLTSLSMTGALSSSSKKSTFGSGSGAKPPQVTQLSRLKLVPNVDSDSVFVETASSLPPVESPSQPAPVLLRDFTEAFVHGDTTNWFKRMLLLDHIENIQDTILSCVEQMEREMDGKCGYCYIYRGS